jgi:predicted DNA-binding transcriptional regulator AlpA
VSDIQDLIVKTCEAQGQLVFERLIEWLQRGGCIVLPEYVNSKQAAAFCGFSPKAFEHHRHAGTGPRSIRIGSQYRYALADLRAWMDAHRVEGDFEPSSRPIQYGGAK